MPGGRATCLRDDPSNEIDSPVEPGRSHKLHVAEFAVTTIDGETHNATLLDDHIISGTVASNWCRDCSGTVVIPRIG